MRAPHFLAPLDLAELLCEVPGTQVARLEPDEEGITPCRAQRLGRENPSWGCVRIQGELRKWLCTLYVLFFVGQGSRRVQLAGVSANPDGVWMHQQARNLAIEQRLHRTRFLLHDRDAKFSGRFDELIRSVGVRVIIAAVA